MYKHIRKLFRSKDTVYVFDIDGVLSAFEYSENDAKHNYCREELWESKTANAVVYPYARPLKTMQEFIRRRKDRCYVCSWETNPVFREQKRDFILKNYGLSRDRIYFTNSNESKLDTLNHIKSNIYPLLSENKICIVEDSMSVLNHIYNNSNYTTIHISSFIK